MPGVSTALSCSVSNRDVGDVVEREKRVFLPFLGEGQELGRNNGNSCVCVCARVAYGMGWVASASSRTQCQSYLKAAIRAYRYGKGGNARQTHGVELEPECREDMLFETFEQGAVAIVLRAPLLAEAVRWGSSMASNEASRDAMSLAGRELDTSQQYACALAVASHLS